MSVEVVEAYKDYIPACNARQVVAELLASVPVEHLAGLRSVVITNSGALPGRRKRGWSWWRGRKIRHTVAAGMYHPAWRGEEAWIELFVDHLINDTPPWALRLPIVRSVTFGSVLFHEIGHHIHETHKPEHREREDVADDWKRRLGQAHLKRHHRLAVWVLRPLAGVARAFRGRARPSRATR